jgi:hypothetical protein
VEQRNAWERAGTRVQMGFQPDVWPWQLARHAGRSVPVDICESVNYSRELYGFTDLTQIDHDQVAADHGGHP